MKRIWLYGWIGWGSLGLLHHSGFVPTMVNAAENGTQFVEQQPPRFIYNPPNRGAPKYKIGGGTRGGVSDPDPDPDPIQVLAPKHVAFTSQPQPRLYWYTTVGHKNKQRFQLSVANYGPLLLNEIIKPQINGGIRHLNLAQYQISLKPGITYHWHVTLEPEPGKSQTSYGSKVSGADIEFVSGDEQLELADPQRRPYLAAQKGFWYDAIDGVSLLVDRGMDPVYWRKQRASLLEQVKLTDVAKYDERIADLRQQRP